MTSKGCMMVTGCRFLVAEIKREHAYLSTPITGSFKHRPVKVSLRTDEGEDVRKMGVGSMFTGEVSTVENPDGDTPPLWVIEKITQVLFNMGEWNRYCKDSMNQVGFDPLIKGHDKLDAYDALYPYTDTKGPHWDAWINMRRCLHLFIDTGVLPGCTPVEKKKSEKAKTRCPACYGYGKIEDSGMYLTCPVCDLKMDDRAVEWLTKEDEPTEVTCPHCKNLFKAERYNKFEFFVSRRMSAWDVEK